MSFVVYLFHVCADKWGKASEEVYSMLEKSKCIDDYLVSNYSVLHTQGTQYLFDDIEQYLKLRGITV